jgi:hypothetical protein
LQFGRRGESGILPTWAGEQALDLIPVQQSDEAGSATDLELINQGPRKQSLDHRRSLLVVLGFRLLLCREAKSSFSLITSAIVSLSAVM